jgi:hypothetical protein
MSSTPLWESHDVRVAVAQIQGLVDGFASDASGDGFRRELEVVIAESGDEDVGERVARLLYGAAIVGAAAQALAAELGRAHRTEVRAMTGDAVNTWLDLSD